MALPARATSYTSSGRHAPCLANSRAELGQGLLCELPKLVAGGGVEHGRGDPGDHVGTERLLLVQHRLDGDRGAGGQVEQGGDHGRRAEVEGEAERAVRGVARLDRDQRLVGDDGGDLEVRLAERGAEGPQDGQVGDRVEVGQRAKDPFEVGHLVGERRLGEFQVTLADGGTEDDLTADADRGGLGAGGQRRHLDVGVADGRGAAGEPPAVLDLLRGVGAQVEAGRQRRVRLEPDAAFLAGAVAAAGGVDRDAVPARRVEEGDPPRHPHRAVVEPEVDPLAHESGPMYRHRPGYGGSSPPSRRGTPRSRRHPSRHGRAAGRRLAPP